MVAPLVLPSAGSVGRARRLPWTTVLVGRRHGRGRRRAASSSPGASRAQNAAGDERAGEARGLAARPSRRWVDKTFFREADRLLFVGHSTLVADKADGFAEAENGALEEVANQIGLSIRDPQWIDFVRRQYEPFRTKAIGDLEKATVSGDAAEIERARRATRDGRKRVAESLRKTSGGLAPTERNDLYWEKLRTRHGVKYQVSIRYAIPKANFEKLVEAYADPETAMGAKAVSYFPQLGWRYEVDRGRGGHARGQRLEPALRRHPGGRLGARRAWTAWCTTRARGSACSTKSRRRCAKTGGTLVLKVKRGDAPAIDTRLRIARGGRRRPIRRTSCTRRAAPAPQRHRRPRPRTRPATSGTTTPKSSVWEVALRFTELGVVLAVALSGGVPSEQLGRRR